jgi:hypothetical protein
VSNIAVASGRIIWESAHHFLLTYGECLCRCASTSGIHCRSLIAGVKQRQMNWAAESVHLFVMNRDVAQDLVTYTPASEQLYSSVEYERNIVVQSSNLGRDRCAITYIYLLCSAWAPTIQRQDSCSASPRYLRSSAKPLNTSVGAAISSAASLGQFHITVRVYEDQDLHINDILNAHECYGF